MLWFGRRPGTTAGLPSSPAAQVPASPAVPPRPEELAKGTVIGQFIEGLRANAGKPIEEVGTAQRSGAHRACLPSSAATCSAPACPVCEPHSALVARLPLLSILCRASLAGW